MIKTDLSRFVVTMHSGLCEQYVKSLGLTLSGFGFLFRTHPHALWQQPPPEPVLIPYVKNDCTADLDYSTDEAAPMVEYKT